MDTKTSDFMIFIISDHYFSRTYNTKHVGSSSMHEMKIYLCSLHYQPEVLFT